MECLILNYRNRATKFLYLLLSFILICYRLISNWTVILGLTYSLCFQIPSDLLYHFAWALLSFLFVILGLRFQLDKLLFTKIAKIHDSLNSKSNLLLYFETFFSECDIFSIDTQWLSRIKRLCKYFALILQHSLH